MLYASHAGVPGPPPARGVTVYYGWRPNLPDEGDNHLIELAVAGNAEAVVTYNIKDLQRGQLLWLQLRILTPADCLKEPACAH